MHILDIRNLHMAFRGLVALNDVGFTVEKGEIFGLIGTNGSGKARFSTASTESIHRNGGR